MLIFAKIKRLISKAFLRFLIEYSVIKCMLLSSHTFSFIAYSLRQGHKFKDNSISSLSYPKALARFYSHTPTIRHRPHYLTLATFYEVSLTAPQPSVPFSYLLRRKDETPNVNFTNSKLFANSIYLWYNNTNKHKKNKIS